MKVNQTNGLNRKARKYLLDHCVSKRGAEIMAFGFTGFLNGNEVEDVTLIRESSKWKVFRTNEQILSIYGIIDSFSMTRNTVL